jgi:hypothetical protein
MSALITLAFPAMVMWFNDVQALEQAQSYCPFKLLTGLPCPGCGITKSIVCTLHGDIAGGFGHHLFGPAVMVVSIGLLIALPLTRWRIPVTIRQLASNMRFTYTIASILTLYHGSRLIIFIQNHNLNQILHESIWI